MSDQKRHIILRILKFTGWFLLAIIIMLFALRLSLKTDLVNNFAKEQAISLANENLNGTLQIGTMRGDLWKEVTATNISIVQEDTLLTADTLNLKYDVLTLLSGTFNIQEILLSGLNGNVMEEENEQFNVQNIVKEDTSEADTSASTFGVEVDNILLRNSSVSVFSPTFLPDSTLEVNNLNAAASFAMKDEIKASLSSLTFQIREGRLPEPIAVKTAGEFEDDEVTLSELLVETGRSVFTANGYVNLQDSTLDMDANTNPFSLADIQPYLENDLPEEAFDITLEVSGSMAALNLSINVEGEGFDNFLLTSNMTLQDEPSIHKMDISVYNLDVGYFTNDSVDVEIGEFQTSLEGILTSDYENADLTWEISTTQIRYKDYHFEQFFGSGTLEESNLLANIQMNDGNERIILKPAINRIFSDNPVWEIPIEVENINPAQWTQNRDLEGQISLNALIEGIGFELSDEPWKFTIENSRITDSPNSLPDTVRVAEYKLSDVDINGSVDQDSLKINGGIQFIENRVAFNATIAEFTEEIPTYNFWLTTAEFEAAEITDLEDFSTSINFTAKGNGSHFDVDLMELTASIKIDSSLVNGAVINEIVSELTLNEGIISLSDGTLESEIIAGSFSARKKMSAEIVPEDELTIDFLIKSLQPIAPLLGAEVVNAEGPVRGMIHQNGDGAPEFDGSIDLDNIRYDSLFIADNVSGDLRVGLSENYNFDIDFNISSPTISDVTFQDVEFGSVGIASADTLNGSFRLKVASRDAGDITQMGTYAINLNSMNADLKWNTLDFQTPARLMSLESPFNLSYRDASISTDTMSLVSESSAYLKMAIPRADSLNQIIWIEGQDFDFGIIQEMMFRERFIDGVLHGEIALDRSPDSLFANASINIEDLNYFDTDIDLLDLDLEIADERLFADGSVTINGEKKIIGTVNVPFVLEDPTTLDDSFFEQPIEGNLTIEPLQLSRFETILQEYNINDTKGIISFKGTLNGTAGTPYFDGNLILSEPTLSGINIDSAFAQFSYDHIAKNIYTNAEIHAQGQTAASIYSNLPISIDFRTFEVNMPSDTDTIKVDMNTRNFNISVFNDFLDSQYLTRLKGVLNADVSIEGPAGELVPDGYLRLENAEVRVPIAGITLQRIHSEINFTEQGLELKEFRMNSGGGNLNANGTITLEGIEPTDINITTRARQFKLANTNDYNLTIDLNNQLTGSPQRPTASGELSVRNGFIYLQDFGERSVETVELEGEEEPGFSPYDSLAIEMQFNIQRNFYVRNRRYLDLEVELTGELDAQKETGGELQLFGTLTGERGYARPLGKRFELEEADFVFSGPLEDPSLAIRTSYIPQTSQKEGTPIVLFYIIEGTAQEPEFRFESDPQMEQQDIIAYTLFGRPFYALDSWQQVLSGGGSGSSPTDLLVDVLLDEVEALATRELGIDVVQIDNTRSGSDAVTSIKTGWYLNRRTFFSVVNEISSNPKTLFILEYLLKENLDLIITQGDDNRQGIDIRWQYEY